MALSTQRLPPWSASAFRNDDIIQLGSLRQLKNNKTKFFVLRAASKFHIARLEIYHSEKKFQDGCKPNSVMCSSDILSVKRTQVSEHSFALTIFLKDEKFCLFARFEDERDNWVAALNFVKAQSEDKEFVPDFVWNMRIRNGGLAKDAKLTGKCRLAKRGDLVSILKRQTNDVSLSFSLADVRSSGYLGKLVLLQIGSSHAAGPGDLWIEADDARTAEDFHAVLFGRKLVRPSTCTGSDKVRLMSGKMTNKWKTNGGAEKTKLRKTRTLLPFLKSKISDVVGDAKPMVKSKRSHSASDISRVGVNQEGDLEKLMLLQQRSLPFAESNRTGKGGTKANKSKKRFSLFLNMKLELSKSDQNVDSASPPERNTLPRDKRVSLLRSVHKKNMSQSEQDISSMSGQTPAKDSSAESSRLADIRSLKRLNSGPAADLCSSSPNVSTLDDSEIVNGNARPLAMSVNALDDCHQSIFRKTKWRSFEKEASEDSAVSSEDCSSTGSFGSNRSVDSADLVRGQDAPARDTGGCITDQGYIPMNFGCNDDAPVADANSSKHSSVYMLVRPDPTIPDCSEGAEDDQETYMDMTSVTPLEIEAFQGRLATEAEKEDEAVSCVSAARYSPNENLEKSPDDQLTLREPRRSDQKPVPLPPKTFRYSSSSNEGSVFASGSWEDACASKLGDDVDNPIPLPPRSRREQSSQELSECGRSSCDSASDLENPVPLPPKTLVRLSSKLSCSEDERPQSSLGSGSRRPTSVRSASNGSEEWSPPLSKPYSSRKDRSSLGEEGTLVRSSNMIGRPLPSLPRGVDAKSVKPRSESDRGPSLAQAVLGHSKANKDDTPLYSTVDKRHKVLSSQNSVPLPSNLDRQLSENSANSVEAALGAKQQGTEGPSPVSSTSNSSPTSPEKKSKNRFRDIGKRMTVNFRQNKRGTLSPKKRMSEASSHFYVDTGAVGNAAKVPDYAKSGGESSNREPSNQELRPDVEVDDSRVNISVSKDSFPVRPSYLELFAGVENKSEKSLLSKENIYSTVAETDENEKNSLGEGARVSTTPTHQPNTQHIQQEPTRTSRNYETVYTEVTLKSKTSPSMPIKGIKSLARDKKKKAKNLPEAAEPSDEGLGLNLTEVEKGPEPHRRISQKITSSPPTKDGKGYENISLQDGLIRTPLEEVEGRPYMNLGFHKPKTKSLSENRRSADEAAMKLLLKLQRDRKISDELSVRKKSNADIQQRKGSLDLDAAEEEASYVNVGKDRRLVDGSGCVISPGVTELLNRRAAEQMKEEQTAYQNIPVMSSRRRQSSTDGDAPKKSDVEILSRMRLNTPAQDAAEGLYTNVGIGNTSSEEASSQNKRKDRPAPKPRPKKPERRKISQINVNERVRSPSKGEPSGQYDEVSISPKMGYNANGGARINAEIADCSYVNVGSYKDDFDVGRSSEASKPVTKCQSYENLMDEFQPRAHRKKPVEHGLAYADVQLRRDRLQENEKGVSLTESSEGSSPSSGKKNKNQVPLGKSNCAYTEIDFMKSQGISEAVRERRVESFECEHERE